MRTNGNTNHAADAAEGQGSMFSTTIRITRTVRFRGGTTIEQGSVLAAKPSSHGDGFSVAHPRMEGCFAHIPASHAEEQGVVSYKPLVRMLG